MDAHVLNRMNMAGGRFLRLELIEYRNGAGKVCYWEAVQRAEQANAAIVVATMKKSGKLVLVRQFRPPLGAYSLEFPAGLVDPGESIEDAARRELAEETGYSCNVLWHTGDCSASPGMSGECVAMVFAEIDEDAPENARHEQNLQDNEEIEVLFADVSGLGEVISAARKRGDVVCSRLAAWAAANGVRW